MLIGRFGDTTGRPYLEARVLFPRFKIQGQVPLLGEADVSFLADTGADLTTIMPADFARFSINYIDLNVPFQTVGVGGAAKGHRELAIVTFVEKGVALHAYTIEALILAPSPEVADLPSLLGRDIMNNWSITFNKPKKTLFAQVCKADETFKLSKTTPPLPGLAGVAPAIIRT